MNRNIYNLVDDDGNIFDNGVLWELEEKHGFRKGFLIKYHRTGFKIQGKYYVRDTGQVNESFKAKRKVEPIMRNLPTQENYTMSNGQILTLIHNYKGELMRTVFHPITN
jgi:hypothetical protein